MLLDVIVMNVRMVFGILSLEMDVKVVIVIKLEAIIHLVIPILGNVIVNLVLLDQNVINACPINMDSLLMVVSNAIVIQVVQKDCNAT